MKHFVIFLFLMHLVQFGQAQPVQSFFVVHADPHEPTGVVFSDLVELVDTANSYGAKLTMEFSKPWCDSILNVSSYLDSVRNWQIQGHEIGVHHHDYGHVEWDGYSNTSTHPVHTSLQPYLGDMSSVYSGTDAVCGDSLCLTVGTGPDSLESATDFYSSWIYKTDGSLDDSSAFSNVIQTSFAGYSVCTLGYTFLETPLDMAGIQSQFGGNPASVCGVVTHVWNWAANKNLYANWFSYISNQTPGQCKSVRQIIRESGCSIATGREDLLKPEVLRVYPVPSPNGKVKIEFGDLNVLNLEVQSVNGKSIYQQHWGGGPDFVLLNLEGLPKGFYWLRIMTTTGLKTKKLIIQ